MKLASARVDRTPEWNFMKSEDAFLDPSDCTVVGSDAWKRGRSDLRRCKASEAAGLGSIIWQLHAILIERIARVCRCGM